MRLWALRKLLGLSLRRDASMAFASVFGIALAVGSLLFFLGVGLGITAFIQQLFPVEAKRFEVKAPKWAVGAEEKRLDEAACEAFQKLPHIQATYRKMEVRAPGATRINQILNMRLNMGLEVLAVGVEPALFEAEVPAASFVEDEEAVPVVLNTHLIELYNQHFAPKSGLPALKGDMLKGFGFDVFFNQSFFAGKTGEVLSQEFFVAGFSPRAFLAGISIPLESAKRLNRALGKDDSLYTSVVLETDDAAHLPAAIKHIEGMGFHIDDGERRWVEQLGLAIWATTGALSLLSVLIGVLAALNIRQGLLHALRMRESEFAIFRAIGATSRQLEWLIAAEALVLALAGGCLGIAAAWASGEALNGFLFRTLGAIPLLPERFFVISVEGCGAALAGALWVALFSLWRPCRRLKRMAPAEILAGR